MESAGALHSTMPLRSDRRAYAPFDSRSLSQVCRSVSCCARGLPRASLASTMVPRASPARGPSAGAPSAAAVVVPGAADGAHTDYTGFTILHQDESDLGALDAGGLQVRLKTGEWHAVRPVANAFVVNIGDLYEVWTVERHRPFVHTS